MSYLPDLDRLLTVGSEYVDERATYVVERHRLDDVVLPTGRVVACDPLTVTEVTPFLADVAPGRYPLWAWVAAVRPHGGDAVPMLAALQLEVRATQPTTWSLALLEGQDMSTLAPDGFFGFPVDAGTACLADRAAIESLARWEFQRIDEAFIPAQIPVDPVEAALSVVTDEESGANVVAVTSGLGDGVYPTFIGHTAHGEVTSFVTEFLVVPEESPSGSV